MHRQFSSDEEILWKGKSTYRALAKYVPAATLFDAIYIYFIIVTLLDDMLVGIYLSANKMNE